LKVLFIETKRFDSPQKLISQHVAALNKLLLLWTTSTTVNLQILVFHMYACGRRELCFFLASYLCVYVHSVGLNSRNRHSVCKEAMLSKDTAVLVTPPLFFPPLFLLWWWTNGHANKY